VTFDPADVQAAVATITYKLVASGGRERMSVNVTLAAEFEKLHHYAYTSTKLDDRRYQELVDEALARIPVHNPNGRISTRAIGSNTHRAFSLS